MQLATQYTSVWHCSSYQQLLLFFHRWKREFLEKYILFEMTSDHCLKFHEQNNSKLMIFALWSNCEHLKEHIYHSKDKRSKSQIRISNTFQTTNLSGWRNKDEEFVYRLDNIRCFFLNRWINESLASKSF